MARFITIIGVVGFLVGVVAIVFAFIHPMDAVTLAGLANLSLFTLGLFFFTHLSSLQKRIPDRLPLQRINMNLMKLFFLFVVLMVNMVIYRDYSRSQILAEPLRKVLSLQGKTYEWKREEFPRENFPEGRVTGVIAQEVEKVLPGLVGTRQDGYKGVAYQEIVPILIEAVKEQQKIIDSQKKEIDEIKAMLKGMKK